MTFRLSQPELKEAEAQGAPALPIDESARIWLDESGLPLALVRSAAARLGGVAKAASSFDGSAAVPRELTARNLPPPVVSNSVWAL